MEAEIERDVVDPTRPRLPRNIAEIVTDPEAYGDGRIHDAFAWMRANEPLGIAETDDYAPFWVASRHADVRAIASRGDIFLSGEININPIDHAGSARLWERTGSPRATRPMVMMDAPEHTLYRAVTAQAFHARSIDQMADDIRAIAREFVDRLAATGGECDFARTVAFVYPLRVIMSMLGIPPEDEPYLLRLTQEHDGIHDPDRARGGEALSGAAATDMQLAVIEDIYRYFADVLADRRANPRDDVSTLIAQATINGEPMPMLEALSYYLVVATAGHDTTASVTAGAMIQLATHPEEFARVKANRSLVNSFVEEATRWVSPSKLTMRYASADFELSGRAIRKGDAVACAWASASRDEAVFDEPFRFRVDRKPNKLLSYGNGPHVCLGQHLARLEMRILWEELFKRLESVELTGPTSSVCSFQISGPKVAPIRFRMN